MSQFKASVQYQDFDGTAAADNADQADLHSFLQAKGLLQGAEFLIAASLWIGENKDGKIGMVNISAHLFQNGDYDTTLAALAATPDPIPVRTVRLEVSLEEYIGFFKRFAVVLTRRGMNIGGREYVSRQE